MGFVGATVTVALVAILLLEGLLAKRRKLYAPPFIGSVKVRVADVIPVAGGVCSPFKYFQSLKPPASGAVVVYRPTQLVGSPGAPATVTVMLAPGTAVVVLMETLGAGVPFPVRATDAPAAPVRVSVPAADPVAEGAKRTVRIAV